MPCHYSSDSTGKPGRYSPEVKKVPNRSKLLRIAGFISRVLRRALRIPAAFFAEIGEQVGGIGVAEHGLERGHSRPAIHDLLFHRVIVHRLAGEQLRAAVETLQLRRSLGVFVMAVPALVIKHLLAAVGTALR